MARRSKTLTLPDESFEGPKPIAEIEEVAEEYAAYRDERMANGVEEKKRKTRLVTLMETHNLTEYNRDGIEIRFEMEKVIKVRVKHARDGDTWDTDTADAEDGEAGA